MQQAKEHSRLYYILKGTAASLLITVPVFIILTLAVHCTDFPEEYLPPAVFATVILSILASGFLSTVQVADRGWFNGAIVGFLYMMIAVCIRWRLEGAVSWNRDVVTMLLTGILLGTLSGMAGLNLGIRLRRRRRAGAVPAGGKRRPQVSTQPTRTQSLQESRR